MLALRRPRLDEVEAYRRRRADDQPTGNHADATHPGFGHDVLSRTIGEGDDAFERARTCLREWAAHRGAGIEVCPGDAPIAEGETVGLLTRQLGVWILACCRITTVIDSPTTFGFTYVTLPGHPETGWESFVIELDMDESVSFRIEAVSRPALLITRVGAPIARRLQRRATAGYLDALERCANPIR